MSGKTEQRKRPVEFRGLSTHYVTGESISVTFRYPTSSFTPDPDDQVKLYAVGSKDRSLASTSVGDPSKHRLCDGGLYKSGSVILPAATRPGIAGKTCVLLYGSSRLRRVMGKSAPFIICLQKDFPSITITTKQDVAVIEKLRCHSPVGSAAAREGEMSFVAVSGGRSGDWEVVEEEEDENSWSDVGEDDTGRGKEDERVNMDSHGPECWMMMKNANKELQTKVRVLHDKLYGVCQDRERLESKVEEMSTQLSRLHHEKTELKQKNKKLLEERKTLKTSNKQLNGENETLAQHCEKQVNQMAKYESQLKSIASENIQLQQQLHHLQRKSRPRSTHEKPSSDPQSSDGINEGRCKKRPVIDVSVRPGAERLGDNKQIKEEEAETSGSLSEKHIQSIMEHLKGGQQSFQCPVCMKLLHSHETEFSARLHIEHCVLSCTM